MRNAFVGILVFGTLASLTASASAKILNAGAGQPYASACAALVDAQANDEIDVAPGTYSDSCTIAVAGLTIKGVGGQPKFDLSATDHPSGYKGILVVDADNVRLENLELTGAHIPVDAMYGGNGAGIRVEGDGLVVHGCYIHDNQDGILGSPPVTGAGTLTVENTELSRNGMGDACNVVSCTHNIYIGPFAKFIFQNSWSHAVATDTPDKGHLLKSRAYETDLLYNRFTGEDGFDSYEVDLPNGGLGIVVGNVIEKGTKAGNQFLLRYGEEGLSNPDKRLFVSANTFVNDFGKGTFIDVAAGGTLTAHDNLLVGPGTASNTGALSADNLSTMIPFFVAPATYDYHLDSNSPARGIAVDPGSADAFSLTPTREYVQPLQTTARASERDSGAFEYGTAITTGSGGSAGSAGNTAGAGSPGGGTPATGGAGGAGGGSATAGGATNVGGTPSGSAGVTGQAGGATNSAGAGGLNGPGSSKDSGGCSCSQARSPSGLGAAWSSLAVALALLGSRRRSRPA